MTRAEVAAGSARPVIAESASGVRKRLVFARAAVERFRPRSILDIGCGTGELVTVPNGYGPSEKAAMVFGVLRLTGAYGPIHRLRTRLQRGSAAATVVGDTLAVSPHVNFFSFAGIHRVFAAAGVRVVEFRPRT